MSWFNYYGLIIVVIILIPNIVYALKHRGQGEEVFQNKALSILEQIGRYGSMIFMVFNIPYLYFNFWFDYGLIIYLSVNGALLITYILGWVILWNKETLVKALLLSIVPAVIFLFSGITLLNIPLMVVAIIFGVSHIIISVNRYLSIK